MATAHANGLLNHLRQTLGSDNVADLSDGQLLERFLAQRDETAFAALVRRHGRMVWGVCQRGTRSHHDAEDAFQATFLVLVRKANSVRPRSLVGNWLYGVACNTAAKARTLTSKRQARERQVLDMPETEIAPAATDDLLPVLDRELSGLPDLYRAPIILCDLEGASRKEAARQLGVPEGTLSARLTRARRLLAKRMARHRSGMAGGVLATILTQQANSASVPAPVVAATIKAAGLSAGVVSARVADLAEGVVKTMLLNKLKNIAVVLAILVVLGSGGAYLAHWAQAGDQPMQHAPAPLQGRWFGDAVMEIKKDNAFWFRRGKGEWWGTLKADDGKNPQHIDVVIAKSINSDFDPRKGLWKGIYKVDGDKLKVCFGIERPTEFADKEASKQEVFEFKKIAESDPNAKDPPPPPKPDAPKQPNAKSGVKLWAGISVSQPIFVAKNTTVPGLFQINFTIVNDGDKTIDPEIRSSKLLINGKELPDWPFIVGNGPKDKRFTALPAGDNLQFGYALGTHFEKPGVYRVSWQGALFQSNEIEFRVLPQKDN